MCLILFSFQPKADQSLILCANRDEFFARPTASANYWEDHVNVLAGRDLVCRGTWLGITTTGRFAAVTNVREPNRQVDNARSRGDLTREYLSGNTSPEQFLRELESHQDDYAGFNLLLGQFNANTDDELYYFSNRQAGFTPLQAGIYGLSNHLLDSHWPKVDDGKEDLEAAIKVSTEHDYLRPLLENSDAADDERLPDTGVGYAREKQLSPKHIALEDYGTRASTVVTIEQNFVRFSEQNYLPAIDGELQRDGESRHFSFTV